MQMKFFTKIAKSIRNQKFWCGKSEYGNFRKIWIGELITLLAYMPTVLLSPLGGVLADRYDRRFLMIIGDLCSGLGKMGF